MKLSVATSESKTSPPLLVTPRPARNYRTRDERAYLAEQIVKYVIAHPGVPWKELVRRFQVWRTSEVFVGLSRDGRLIRYRARWFAAGTPLTIDCPTVSEYRP